MTRDEDRKKCIEAMKESARRNGHLGFEGDVGTAIFTAAFDALYGIVRVCPISSPF